MKYPVGTFVESEKGYFYIVAPGKRGKFSTQRCLDSWSPQRVIKTTEKALKNYRVSQTMKFRNGSLIHNIADGRVYLIEKGKRRALASPEAFELLGVERSRRYVMTVSLDEIELHEEGELLT